MVLTISFAILSFIALGGASGLLIYRRILPCLLSFLSCVAAIGGLYFLLNLQFMAMVQLLIGVALAGAWLAANLASAPDDQHRPAWYYLPPAILLGAAICWSIVGGRVGEPILISAPVWAAQTGYLAALGQQLSGSYATLFLLVGLLLLTCVVSAAYMIGQNEQEKREET